MKKERVCLSKEDSHSTQMKLTVGKVLYKVTVCVLAVAVLNISDVPEK